ncbi:MAG: esterase-like activity of phytase family protein [Gordonia sp. (in: high G+C Gram-positive bacteria)]
MRIRVWGATVWSVLVVVVASTLSAGSLSAAPFPGAGISARYTDTAVINSVPTFGAISGFDRIGPNKFALISADVGRSGPARFFTGRVNYLSDVVGFSSNPVVGGGGLILGPGNTLLAPGSAQFEGIRKVGGGYVVVSGGAHQFIRIQGSGGSYIRDLPLPVAWQPGKTTGLIGQRGLTGVAVGPRGQISVLTAGGLKQDPATSARLLVLGKGANTKGRGTAAEYVYKTDPGQVAADVLAFNNTDYLVLERGKGRATELFWTTIAGADQVGGRVKLGGTERAMSKRLLFTTARVPFMKTGNMAGLAWGNWAPDDPTLDYRSRALFVVTNNVFAGPTLVQSFEIRLPR